MARNPMIYEIHYVGGPNDGQMAFAIRPYFRMKHHDNAVYQAEMEGEGAGAGANGGPVMDWVDDDTRAITLHFVGFWPEAEFGEE